MTIMMPEKQLGSWITLESLVEVGSPLNQQESHREVIAETEATIEIGLIEEVIVEIAEIVEKEMVVIVEIEVKEEVIE